MSRALSPSSASGVARIAVSFSSTAITSGRAPPPARRAPPSPAARAANSSAAAPPNAECGAMNALASRTQSARAADDAASSAARAPAPPSHHTSDGARWRLASTHGRNVWPSSSAAARGATLAVWDDDAARAGGLRGARALFARARVVVGAHGAGLANALFCVGDAEAASAAHGGGGDATLVAPPPTALVELALAERGFIEYENLAAALGLRYRNASLPPGSFEARPRADVAAVVAVVDDELARQDAAVEAGAPWY